MPFLPQFVVLNETCSHGLHFCAQKYLPSYGSAGNGDRIVIVKVNPRDVVSVPVDYNAAKVRTCRYEVLSEYTGTDKDDLLATKAVFRDSEFQHGGDDDFEIGDSVICIDGSGLGQTDISEGGTYIVDGFDADGRIWIGVSQGIGRHYETWRFKHENWNEFEDEFEDEFGDEFVDDFVDEEPTEEEDETLQYDRGYEQGYAKGQSDAEDPNMVFKPDANAYSIAFVKGWQDAIRASGRELDQEVPVAPDASPTNTEAPEEVYVPISAEADVSLPEITPVTEVDPSLSLVFDPLIGTFKLV